MPYVFVRHVCDTLSMILVRHVCDALSMVLVRHVCDALSMVLVRHVCDASIHCQRGHRVHWVTRSLSKCPSRRGGVQWANFYS